jgi:hypothetical protein
MMPRPLRLVLVWALIALAALAAHAYLPTWTDTLKATHVYTLQVDGTLIQTMPDGTKSTRVVTMVGTATEYILALSAEGIADVRVRVKWASYTDTIDGKAATKKFPDTVITFQRSRNGEITNEKDVPEGNGEGDVPLNLDMLTGMLTQQEFSKNEIQVGDTWLEGSDTPEVDGTFKGKVLQATSTLTEAKTVNDKTYLDITTGLTSDAKDVPLDMSGQGMPITATMDIALTMNAAPVWDFTAGHPSSLTVKMTTDATATMKIPNVPTMTMTMNWVLTGTASEKAK